MNVPFTLTTFTIISGKMKLIERRIIISDNLLTLKIEIKKIIKHKTQITL
jgi:hypothetical protein